MTAFVGRACRGPIGIPTRVASVAEYERRFGPLTRDATMGYAVRHFFANGGRDALIVRVSGPLRHGREADLIGSPAAGTGMHALQRGPAFNLLCLPPPTRTTDHSAAVWNAAAALCEARRALLIVDAPGAWTTPPLAEDGLRLPGVPLERTSAAAVYFPRLLMADPLANGDPAPFAPCGAVAGVMCRLDAARGVWRPPAGMEARVAPPVAPEAPMARDDDDRLALLGVNAIRTFEGSGTLLWGARTWDHPGSEWKYVNVRRLGYHLEVSIDEGTRWATFEPNGEPLWARLRQEIRGFLDGYWRAGALQGRRPQEGYFVQCGLGSTMTQDDIDNGRLVIVIGIAPVRPAEFALIRIGRQVAV